jgi:hypothetical protein
MRGSNGPGAYHVILQRKRTVVAAHDEPAHAVSLGTAHSDGVPPITRDNSVFEYARAQTGAPEIDAPGNIQVSPLT